MFIDLLYKRRSIRTFSSQPVEKEKTDTLLKAALLAPSSRSRHPCRFIAVTEKETLEKLARAKHHGAGFLKAAPCAIVVAVGYPRTPLPPRRDEDLHFENVSYERFGGKAE